MEEKEFDYINVIPFVDVMLVLLTIVLMTSTFIATGLLPVELPKASISSSASVKNWLIEIDKRGVVYFNSRPLAVDALKGELEGLDRNVPVLIRSDQNIALQVFVDVLDVAKGLEFRTVSLQTEDKR
jgi:biopolymer transport protein ExbD